MNQTNCLEAAQAFSENSQKEKLCITPLKGGLINYSCVVRSDKSPAFILQKINQNVFRQPEAVQDNYLQIWQHASQQKSATRLPQPIALKHGGYLFCDKDDNFWRASEFIEESFSPAIAVKPTQAFATAEVFAQFTSTFYDFDIAGLQTVINDFHNLDFRFEQFQHALETENLPRLNKARIITNELLNRITYRDFYNHIVASPSEYQYRVMHHDAKIANVLFEKESGKVICPIDFDTVMPGFFFSDLGDMIRSMACNYDENFKESNLVRIRPDFYESIITGYLNVMSTQLSESEKKNIHFAGILMIYMQALRFLTDYLNKDVYYLTDYPEQNLDRATNQLALLRELENYLHNHHRKNTSDYLPAK